MKPLTERVAYHSVKGRRPSNQDSVVVGMLADGRAVAAVADGMGGRLAGDVASQRALEVVVDRLRAGDELTAAVEESNRAVFDESRANADLHGMGTTVVAMLQDGDEYVIANVGDSRAYRLGRDGISKVTADHSFTAEAIEAGEMTPEDAVLSPWANALTRAIGTDPEVEVDLYGPYDATESHAILLCSDGFHKPLSEDGILTSVLGCDANGETAMELTEIALRAGSDDNITIALISFGDQSWMDLAVRARHELWDLEDAPTVEFQQTDDESPVPEPAPGEPPDDDLAQAETEWVLPEPEDDGEGLTVEAEGLIEAGVIGDGIAPMRPSFDEAAEAVTAASPEAANDPSEGPSVDPVAANAGVQQAPDTAAEMGRPRHRGARRRQRAPVLPGRKVSGSLRKKRAREKAVRIIVLLVLVVAIVALALRLL